MSRAQLWFLNHLVNPVVRLVLRSPLHAVASGALLLLTYQGRRSGRRRTIPVQYAQDGQTILVVVGSPERKRWWRNLVPGGRVRIRLRGRELDASAEVLTSDRDPAAVAEVLDLYVERFPHAPRGVTARRGSSEPTGLRVETTGVVLVRLTLGP